RSSQTLSCRQSSTAQSRSLASAAAQPSSSSLATSTVLSASGRPASSTATAVTACLCTSTPITTINIASTAIGGDRRADRPQSRRKPRSYQVTLDGLGTAAATQRSKVSESDIRIIESAAAARVCASHRTPPGEDDIEFRNDARPVRPFVFYW